MRVKPAVGLIIRDPATARALPEGGCDVPETTYWRRRLSVGDVVLVEAAAVPQPQKHQSSIEDAPVAALQKHQSKEK